MKDEPIPPWLTDKLGQILSSAKSTVHSHVHLAPILPSQNVIRHADQVMVRPQSHSLPLVFNPPESAYRSDPPIDYTKPSRPCSQVDSPPVCSPQSSNCSDNGDNVPDQSWDEYFEFQADAWVLAENISDYDYDDNHSQPSLNDENTHCYDSDYQHGYPPDPPNLKDHSDLDSSWNNDQDSWLTLDNSRWPPPVSQENPTTEAGPPETMVDEQSLAFLLTESQVVMAGELARLQQELQSVQNTLADKHDHFVLASKAYEQEIQHLLASNNRLCHSITQLQVVMRPSCSPTQSPSDVSLAQAKDVNGSHVNPDSFPYPSVNCIQECLDTPVPNGIQQRLSLPRPKSRPQLSLKKDVPSWPDVPRPQSKPRLSLKRASNVPNSPDVVPAIASEDVYHASKCTSTLSDSDLGVSDEVETCIPSLVASLDLNDVTTCNSEVSEGLSHVKSALSHAYAVLEHSLACDIKLHPPDKSHFNSPPLSVTSASPKSPFDKVAPVQCRSGTHNLCPTLYTGKEEKHLNCSGDKALGDENTHQPMVSPPVLQGSIDHSPDDAQSLASSGHAYRPSLLSSKGLNLPVSHDENAHHVVPHNPFLVAPNPSKDKLNPGTKKLYGCDPVPPDLTASNLCQDKPPLTKAASPIAKKTCRACAAPSRYFIHCHS